MTRLRPAREWAEEFAAREPYATKAAYIAALAATIDAARGNTVACILCGRSDEPLCEHAHCSRCTPKPCVGVRP